MIVMHVLAIACNASAICAVVCSAYAMRVEHVRCVYCMYCTMCAVHVQCVQFCVVHVPSVQLCVERVLCV